MYSCPTDDIHSIYLDKELPSTYLAEYEQHLKNCPKCQKKLDSLKRIHEIFQKDKIQIAPDSIYLERSFERIQTKLKYSKNVKQSESFMLSAFSNPQNQKVYGFAKYALVAAAAVALVIVPVKLLNIQSNPTQAVNFSEVAMTQDLPVVNENVVINGNISQPFAVSMNNGKMTIPERDVFRPNFRNINKISVEMTVPGLDKQNYSEVQIRLPVNSNTGILP